VSRIIGVEDVIPGQRAEEVGDLGLIGV
jgi:hypothetical protein